jgi:hypothetical protein
MGCALRDWRSFPMGIRTLSGLRTLDLGHNNMRMNFPAVYEALGAAVTGLSTLVLSHNQMFGDIAQSSKGLLPHFESLTTLSLAGNLLGLTYSQACILRGWQVRPSLRLSGPQPFLWCVGVSVVCDHHHRVDVCCVLRAWAVLWAERHGEREKGDLRVIGVNEGMN